jgi:thiamine biosynthesis lipoprotein
VQLWRRARRTGELPAAQQLARARGLTGYRKLHLDGQARSVRLERIGMRLDLGGIAKGFAADEAIAVLKRHGINSALVAAGGDIAVSGPPPGAAGWLIAIAPPGSSERPPRQHLLLRAAAVSTSGDAEQYVEVSGVRYSHVVDPRTGLGVVGHSSVTVVAPDGTTSDALATAASVLGPGRGLKLIDSTEGAAALFIQATGQGSQSFESKRWHAVPKGEPGAVK